MLKSKWSRIAETFFAGKVELAKLSFLERTLTRAIGKSQGISEGDHRDWDGIRAWALALPAVLGLAAGTALARPFPFSLIYGYRPSSHFLSGFRFAAIPGAMGQMVVAVAM